MMFYENLARKIELPVEVLNEILALQPILGELSVLQMQLLDSDYAVDELKKSLAIIAKETKIHPYQVDFYLLLLATKPLYELYQQRGINDEIFFDTMRDLVYKLRECQMIHGINGTFVFDWYPGFYRLERFALGRLQYEFSNYDKESYDRFGVKIEQGDLAFGLHVPSSGPLNRDECYESYQRACKFFETDWLVLKCHSWFFNPYHQEFLPANSNILAFINDFDIIDYQEETTFNDAWRIFGLVEGKDVAEWPESTSLQRAYKQHLLAGGSVGTGYAILVFDGEKVINLVDKE